MKFSHKLALLAVLACALDLHAQEVGLYPNANTPLAGNERILADQSGTTVNITPSMLNTYIFPTGVLPVSLGGTGVPSLTGLVVGNGAAPFSAATAANVYALWSGCTSSTFLRGDGVCITPSGAGTVTTSGTVTTGTLAAFSGSTAITNAVVADVLSLWTGTCSSSTFLRGDGSCQSVSGSGTVTSIALTVPPALLSVSGSPITSSGTLAVALANQSANTVLAGPLSGSPVAPTFRALTVADIPIVPLATGVSGTLNVSNGGSGVSSLTGLVVGNGASPFSAAAFSNVTGLWSGTCNSSTYLRGDGQCQTPPGGGGGGGSGTVTTTGTPVSGQLAVFSGSTSIAGLSSLTPALGGTGVNNGSSTITLGGNFSTSAPLGFSGGGSVSLPLSSGTYTLGYLGLPFCNGGSLITGTTYAPTLNDVGQSCTANITAALAVTINATLAGMTPGQTTFAFHNLPSPLSTANVTIALSSGTLYFEPSAGTGTRTLPPGSSAVVTFICATCGSGSTPVFTTSGNGEL
jgi:hypothetical protein